MLNDSIYSPRHCPFISASAFSNGFAHMHSLLVCSRHAFSVSIVPVVWVWSRSEDHKCAGSHYRLRPGVCGAVAPSHVVTQRFLCDVRHRSDCSSGRSLKSFILKSMLTGDDMMETGLLNWLCPLSPTCLSLPRLFVPSLFAFYLFFFFFFQPPPSFSPHRLDVSSTRCQIISQQTLRCVTEDWSCISLDDTSSASPPLSADNIKYGQAFLIT